MVSSQVTPPQVSFDAHDANQSAAASLRSNTSSLNSINPSSNIEMTGMARNSANDMRQPIARIGICAYPGSSFFSRGHSFLFIEPVDATYGAGTVDVGGGKKIGRIAVGLGKKGHDSSDRIWDYFQFRSKPGQLRNDDRYLRKSGVKTFSVDIYDQAQLLAGISKINQDAQASGLSSKYISKINDIEMPALEPINTKAHLNYHYRNHNSNDYAVELFEEFGVRLPKGIETNMRTGMSSKAFSKQLTEKLQKSEARIFPQTIPRYDIKTIVSMRQKAPKALSDIGTTLGVLKNDLELVNKKIKTVTTEGKQFLDKYQEPVTNALKCMSDELGDEGKNALEAIQELRHTISSAADLAGNVAEPGSIIGLMQATVATVTSQHNIQSTFEVMGGIHKLVLGLDHSLNAIQQALQCTDDKITFSDLYTDLEKLYTPTKELIEVLSGLPDRLLIGLDNAIDVIHDLAEPWDSRVTDRTPVRQPEESQRSSERSTSS